jgi:pimeloyl-ACP methyl ester carboxylesterase
MRTRLLVAVVLLALPGVLAAADRRLELTPCPEDFAVSGAQCGTFEVFEDRASGKGRRIGLQVAVLPALGNETRPDPLFLLAGGPGMGATDLAEMAERYLRRIREQREIILVDQRGTGDSNGLDCEDVDTDSTYYNLSPDYPYEILRDCMDTFDADLRLYTTPIAMDDLDDVRAALGYEQINIWGGSYGTRAALVYLRRHEDHVRTVIVDGLAPPAIRLPLHAGEDAQRALQLVFVDCAADADCSAAFPHLQDTFQRLVERLEISPESVRAAHPRTGEMVDFEVGRNSVVLLLRAALYSADATRLLPLIIQRAHDGDYGPLLALSDPLADIDSFISIGMLFSVLCAEDLAYVTDRDIAALATEPLLGTTIMDTWGEVCGFWPRGELPSGYHEPVVSDKPVLVLSGELDPVTPPRWGQMVARHLQNGQHIVVPGAAHGTVMYGCVQKLMTQFVDEASVAGLDPTCAGNLARPLFFRSLTGPGLGELAQ